MSQSVVASRLCVDILAHRVVIGNVNVGPPVLERPRVPLVVPVGQKGSKCMCTQTQVLAAHIFICRCCDAKLSPAMLQRKTRNLANRIAMICDLAIDKIAGSRRSRTGV